MKAKATARVQVTLVVDLGQAWGADCTVGQVRMQAEREAREAIDRACEAVRGVAVSKAAVVDICITETTA